MAIIYDVGLLLALLIGAAIGLLVTASHYEQIALRQWAYEKEVAEGREFYAALGMLRRVRPERSAGSSGFAGSSGSAGSAGSADDEAAAA